MTRSTKAVIFLFFTVVLILGLSAIVPIVFGPRAHAQTQIPSFKIDGLYSGLPQVYEGAAVRFQVSATGGFVFGTDVTVEVQTWEPNLDDGAGNNPSLQTHQVRFHGLLGLFPTKDISVTAYVDGVDESTEASHILKARLVMSSDGSYALDAQNEAEYTILDPPTNIPRISIASDSTSVAEGDPATFTLTRTGDTASALTVQVNIDDPQGFTRDDFWDPPPVLPTSVVFDANSSTATLSLQAPDDHRDLSNGPLSVEVQPPSMQPSPTYLPGHTGLNTRASTTVTDNDTAQELELNFGKDGVNGANLHEGDKLAFVVKRRQQDADPGNPARFTVRIETDRSGDDWRLEDWTEDSGTGRLYKDYPLELTGSDLQLKEEFTVTFNGQSESNWDYWASIKPIEDHEGNQLTSSEEAQYWTVKAGFRETTIDATDSGTSNGTISIDSDVLTVTEGQAVVYTLYRIDGPMNKPVTVRVQTSEPNRQVGFGDNPSTEYHNVTIEAWRRHADFTVYPYVDGVTEAGADEMIADMISIGQVDGANRYTEGLPNRINVEINDPPSNSTFVTLSANPTSIVEGGSTNVTFNRTGGDLTQPLTVNIHVDDPDGRLRGNHWDPAPAIPTQVTFQANSTTKMLTLTFPDDQRDLEPAGLVNVYVLPGTGYYLGQSGIDGTFTTLSVTDDDTAQELSFKWGQISPDSEHWEAGESYLTCDEQDNCTPGPAEGTFYYGDDRGFVVSHRLQEPHPAHFLVSRRAQDTGKTATFIVRVEHNRAWESPRHTSWPTDPETGNRYQEFPLTLTGNQRQVVGRIEVLDNGILDHNLWQYSAEIKQTEDAADGTALSPTDEAQYWTVSGDRKKTIWPGLTLGVHIQLKSVTPKELPEGQDVTIALERRWGNPLESYTVQVRTWEPNQRMADGTNPTDQLHDVVFPAIPMTDLFVEYVTQTETLTVATLDDSVYEPQDTLMVGLLVPSSLSDRLLLVSTKNVRILDDDRPTIALSVDDTSITEGDTATFTLTRGHNTANELIVGVSVDDPGGFLEGNYASDAVEVPSSVVFAPGESTKEITITPPDDWRDILDNAITFTLVAEPHYDIVGSSSLTVQVGDNDVAPQVSISFNHAEVDEGTDLVLEISRIGEDKNPLEIPITAGPVGDQAHHVFGMDAGMSLLTFRYHQPDDSYKGPDHHYEATLQPGRPEFWTPASTATITGSILDNDPYVVGVEAYRNNINEGNLLDYRIFHNGHTGEPLQVKVNHSENGNAVYDTILGNQVHTIPAGTSYITPGYITHRNDGYDGDAEFTVELLVDDAYEINSSYPSGTIIVRNTDPLPVLGFRDATTTVSEGDGTIDVWVDMLTALPSLKTTTVDYSVNDHFTGDGLSVTQSRGTLTFAPGETSASIPVEVLQNSIAGYKERFHIVLSNPVNAALQDGVANLVHDGVIEDDESAVTLEAQAEAVDEGSDVILTLTRDGDTTDELTVWLQVAKTAPHADNRQQSVVFPAGDATVEHTITTTDDGVRDGSHTVTATLLDPPTIGEPRTYWQVRPSSVTVTVRDTNLETVVLLASTLRVAEGESITLELSRSGRSPLTVTLEVTETGDYTTGTLPETVTFALQQANASITIPTQDDSTAEDVGKLTVTLVDGTDYRAGWPNSHTFTIYDNDGTKPSVSVTRDQTWVDEGDPVSFTVTRSTPTTNALQARLELNRVRYRVTQADLDDPTRGITTPEDHIHFDTEEITVDFSAGTRTVTVTRQTNDDSLNYGNSTYHATVLSDAGDDYVALYNASAKIWVQDDDIPTVTGSSTTSEFYDGFDPVILPFSRTGDVSGRLFLDAEITHVTHWPAPLQDDTTTRDEVKGWLFDPGDPNGVGIGTFAYTSALGRSGTLELQSHYCPDSPASCGYYPQYQVGTPSSISYNYHSRFMGVRITRDHASVTEGDAATFTLYRHGGKPDSITRPLQVNVLVTQEGEYISGAAPQTVTFAANQATVTLSVPTTDDGVDELDGTITVELQFTGVTPKSCPPQDDSYCYRVRDYPGTPWHVRSQTTSVTDNDYVPPDVSVSDASAGESDGTIEFTVTLDRANNEHAASVDWTTAEDGSTTAATSNVDFIAASGRLNFAIGETEKTVTVSLLDDQLDEADETFNVVLTNPSELTLANDTGEGTIVDDDIGHGIAFIGSSTFHTEEGDDVQVSLQRLVPQESGGVCYVTIQGECFSVATEGDTANGAITVNLGITQTGDFMSEALPTTVTFARGAASVELSLSTVDDSAVEADGSLTFNILEGTGYSPVYIGPPDSHNQGTPYRTLYLYDNDLAFSIDDDQADESAGQLDFTVRLNAPAPQQVTVDVATADGEATSHANVTATSLGQDFEAKTETLTFAAGEQTKTFSVVTLDDTIHERNETFTAKLSTPAQNLNRYNSSRQWSTLTILSDVTAVGTIDDDDQALVASVSRAYSIVNEDQVGPVRFTVELSHPNTTASERNPAVGWRTAPGTAVLGADYQGANGKLTFMPGVNTGFIDVDIVDDILFESSLETFRVELVANDTRLATISSIEWFFEVSIRDNETLTASISADAVTVAEGNDTTFTVTLTGGVPADDVSVPFETSGTATVTDDYSAPKGAITFPPGDASGKAGVLEISAGESKGTITFPVLADGISENQETLKVEIFSAATDQRAGSVSTTENIATTRILDQDELTVSISDAPSVTEGSVATFTITLSTISNQDVSAGWSTKQVGNSLDAGETAVPDKDYTAASGTVAIPAGDRSATFTVATTQDTLAEGVETFVVMLEEVTIGNSSPPEMVPLGVTKAEGTIVDDDTAPTGLTISSVSHNQVDEDAGATDITVTVALDGTTQFTVGTPVTLEMIDRPGVQNNATLGVDYTATTANVTIPAGESSVTATITLTPVDDTLSEDDEIARLSAKSTVFAGSTGKGVKIVDNDVEPGEIMLTVDPDSVSESASSLHLTVTGTLAGVSSRVIDTIVSLELADDTATVGEDFQSATATLTIPAGEMSATATMTLEVLDDDIAEGNETLEVTGTVPGTITVTPADVVIEDDDQEPTSISLLATTGPISEGGGAVTIPVRATLLGGGTRSVDTDVMLSVEDVSATVSDDYTAAWDSSTLTIPAGEFSASANLTLIPVEDTIYEGDEQIAVRGLNSAPGLPVNGVRLTIVDNDPKPTTVTLTLGRDTVSEGDNIHFERITATLEGASTLASDVNLSVNLKGDTQRSQSYTATLFNPLLIEAGQSSGTANLYLSGTDDDVEDEDETVTIEGRSDHPDLMVVPTQLVIANDDTSEVRVTPVSLTIQEGKRQHYRVALATEPTANVVVTVDVPANAGFTVNPGSLTFTPQSWSRKYVFVQGIHDDDGDDEPPALITHSISSTDTHYRDLSAPGVAVTIRDDDDPLVEVSFGETTYTVNEGETVDITLSLSVDPERPVTIPVTATDQDGASSADYSGVPTNVTFASGETEKTVTFTATQDTDDDDGESVKLGFGTLPDRVLAGTTSESTVSITDDDLAEVKVNFGAATYNAAEGDTVDIIITLDADPGRQVSIPIVVTEQDGVSSADYSNVPSAITFNTGDTERRFAFTATQDDIDDDGESVLLKFDSSLPAGVTEGSMVETTVSIVDDDTVGVTISETSLEIEEGDSDDYTVILDTEPVGDVTVTIEGVTGTEVSLNNTTLTFTSGNWATAQTVTVTALQDDDAVDEEVVTIKHTVSSSDDDKYDGLSANNVPVTVTDDDTVGVTISEISLEIEEGDFDTYTVVLDTEPIGDVAVAIGGVAGADLTLDKTTLTFTTGNWDTAQTVRVTAGQDDDAVDEEVVNITHTVTSADDSGYDGLTADNVPVTVTDADTVGVTISETSLEIEEGDFDTYTVVLDTEPVGDVTVTIGGIADTDLTLDKTTLTFTTGNWDTAQEVKVTAEQDDDAVDEEEVTITHTVSSTADTDYDDVAAGNVAVTMTDDEVPSPDFTLTMEPPTHGDTDVDGKVNLGDTLRYTAVATNSGNVPLENVNVKDALINTSGTDCTSLPIGATCTSTVTYTIVQADVDTGSVSNTATGTADGVADKTVTRETTVDQVAGLEMEKTTTADGFAGIAENITYSYKVINSGTVTLLGTLEIDDDKISSGDITCPAVPGGGLAPGAFLTCSGSYTTTQADVDVGKVTNEATATLGGVTSGSDSVTINWQAPQGSQPQLTVGSGEDDENAGSFTFTVTLNPSSLQTVTVDYVTTGGNATSGVDYTHNSGTLTFSPGETTKNVIVAIANDDVDESDETFNLTLSGPVNASIPIPNGTFTIRDDDTAGVTLSDTSLDIDEGDSGTYSVVLESQPTHDVTITANDPSNTDVTADPADLTFTPSNWDTAQTVTVTASQDSGHDDENGTVTHTAISTDTKYAEISVDDVLVNVTDDEDVPVTVSFEQSSYTVAEGGSETVKVKLSADPERTVEVPISVTDMDGASSSDYSIVPTSVVFNSGDTEKTLSFSATDDAEDDDGERVRLTFGTLPSRVTSTSPSQAVVSITDDDVPEVTVSFEESSYTVTEGNTVAVKVILSEQPERTVDIQVSATFLGGVGSLDFLGAPTTLNFGANDTEKTLTFSAIDDTRDDDGEKVRLGFVNLPAQVNPGNNPQSTVSINDNDHPQVTVSFASSSYTVAESDDSSTPDTTENEVPVTVNLSADPERTVTIPFTATGQGGATASDYSVPNSVVFNPGDTEKQITFQATPDDVDDDGESVKLGFGSSLPARITAGTPSETTVSITDDDVPIVTVSFQQSSYTVAEGSSVAVKVILSTDPERTVTIPLLKVNQGGASVQDYSNVPGNVVFNSGNTEKTFTFTAASDNVDDDGESVRVSFGTLPDQVSAGTYSGTTVSITDDDVPSVTVSFERSSYTVAEGSSETVKMVMSADPERTVTIPLTKTNQGGASNSDYSLPNSVVFNSGDTEKTFSFSATQDTVDDDGESVKLGFQNLPTGVSAGTTDETTVSITDDDVPSVTVSFEQSSYTVAEGSSEAVKVKLSADPERTVTVPITKTNQGGASNSDYSSVPGNVVFNSGETEKTFDFEATDDAADDDGESVKLGFQNLPTRVSAGTIDETTVSITDDDVPSVTVSFEQSSYTVAEGSSETVKVKLSSDPERTVEVPISVTDMDGASSSDYSIVPQTVVFNSGDIEKTLSFSATDDAEDDDGERVRLNFGALPPRVSSTSPSQAVVSITDDDVPSVDVSFEEVSYSVIEGDTVTVKVVLSSDPERTVTIPLTKTNQGGASNSDYSLPNSVVFNSGDTEKTFSFSATQDTVDDDGESVKLGFQNLPTGVSAGTTDETTVSITDDDVPSVMVSFEESSYTVGEGNTVTVKVKLTADPERTVTVPITKTNQGGASNSDYSSVPGNVVFNSGETEKTFDFEATDDAADDDGESVKLGFQNLPTRVSAGTIDETTVSITDDDVPSVTVSFEQAAYTVAEGDTISVNVVLSADPERTVTIPVTATGQGGATSADYSVPSSVAFNSGDTERTFSFSANQDTANDDGESVKLGFGSSLPTGVTVGSTDETTVSITDDDVLPVTVSFEQASYTVAEGDSVMVKIVLSSDPERTVTIPITPTGQGGATAADYNVPANMVFNSGDTEKTFSLSATQDTVDDDGESVKLGFGSSLPAGVTAGSTDETTVSITDDDVPSVTVSFEQDSYTVAEGDTVIVKVVLSADPERTVSISLTKTNQGGASNSDYSNVPGNVMFNNGDTEKTFSFQATDDSVDDDGESVKLGFGSSLPTGVTKGSTGEATVSIADDDVPSVTVSFERSSYTVAEGSSETLKVVLSADPERTVEVPISMTNMDGASSSDYSIAPQTVVFNSGDTERTFSFSATNDAEDDDGEIVRLNFGTLPPRVSSASPSQAVVSITDDDVPSVTVSFEQDSYTVAEGDTVMVKVVLSTDPERALTIPLTKTNQGGATSADYSVPSNVVFSSGDTEKSFSFSAIDDTDNDDGESVKLGFGSSLPAGATVGSTDETTVSITDDDVPSVTVSFEQDSYTVAEGNTVIVKVVLSADPERTVTIPLTKTNQGGATSADYSVPSNVVFGSGDTEKSFSFSAIDDTDNDDGESVKLGFGSSLPAGATVGSTDETTVSITDDDVPSVTVSFEQDSYTVAEGNTVIVKVVLSADPERTVTIPLTKTNQGGATSADYSVPNSVVFNSGDTEKTLSFSATQDTANDDGESVKLGFGSSLPTGVSEGTTDETIVTITDDDVSSVTVSFEQSSYTVAEGDTISIKVVLSADPERMVTVPLTKTNQGGATSADYSVPNNIVFNSGDTEKAFSFSATQDTANDDGESVKLGFGNTLPTGVSEGTTDETSVSITDDDVPSVTVSFEQSVYTVAEGSSETIKVFLSADPERTVTIPITATGQGGATSADYSVPNSIEFHSGDTEQTFSFSATQDTANDDGESVKLGFGSSLPAGVSKGMTDETIVSITDDDVPSVTVSFEQAAYTVAEGNNVAVKVILSADPERTVTIPITATGQAGAAASDYSVPSSVVFNDGDTEKTLSFSAIDDTDNDDGESVKLGFGSSLPADVTVGSTAETTVSITDDDGGGGFPGGKKEIFGDGDTEVTISFDQASYTAREGSTITVKAILSVGPQTDFSIPLVATGGTGLTSGDYSGVPASLEFATGDVESSFIITAVQDQEDEAGETLTLGFGALLAGLSSGDNTETVVTIIDSVHVSFGATHYEAYEGGSGAEVVVMLDGPAPFEVVVPITSTGMNGATSADWTGVPPDVTFATGDTQKSFTLMAYDDEVEDDGESVELGFGELAAGVAKGSPSVATVELMNTEVPTCETAVWCATVEFADSASNDWSRPGLGLGYHTTQEPYVRYSSLSDNRFTFRGKEYQVWSLFTSPGTHPDVSPGSPGRIPEYSTFSIYLKEVVGGELKLRVDQDHQRDWTLYIDGIALPFTEIVSGNGSGTRFVWHHPKLQDLYANWTDGDTYEIMIAEDPANDRPDPPVTAPMEPRYLRVIPGDGSLVAVWKQPLKDGNSDITHYRIQWKLGTESWSDPNAIEEAIVQPSGGGYTEVYHMITGLTNYALYTLRVIAVNGVGDSEPSVEHFGMPQEDSLHITDTVVNGNQLTFTYDRTLDDSSVPSQESFWVLVNGAPRNVTGVSISGKSVVLTLEEPAKRGIKASDEVEFRYVTPPSGAPAIKDTAGNYAYSCEFGEPLSEARNETDPGLLEPITAEFTMVPASHSGPGNEVVFQIEFSEPVRIDIGPNFAYLLNVEGGEVTSAWWLDGDSTIWEIVVEPTTSDGLKITLPAGRACDAQGAPCSSGQRRLSRELEYTIPGPNS